MVRRLNADITIEDPLISRRHAFVRPADDSVEVEDLGSLNGTWSEERERIVGTKRLAAGDVITVGTTSMEVQADPGRGGRTVLAKPGDASRAAEGEAAPPSPAVVPAAALAGGSARAALAGGAHAPAEPRAGRTRVPAAAAAAEDELRP